ncbi:MAG TPA: hypothetical protein VJV78_27510 [Polyangiales bacterium]|nr:hypothetical protein [Polyangiales bacterium]
MQRAHGLLSAIVLLAGCASAASTSPLKGADAEEDTPPTSPGADAGPSADAALADAASSGKEAGTPAKPDEPDASAPPSPARMHDPSERGCTDTPAWRSATLPANPLNAPNLLPSALATGVVGFEYGHTLAQQVGAVRVGELFWPLADGRVLVANPMRGPQIIDVRDPNAPRVLGELPEVGWPFAIHALVGNRALLSQLDQTARRARLIAVDLGDLQHPRIESRLELPGTVAAAHFVQNGARAALYAAVQVEDQFGGLGQLVLQGVDLGSQPLSAKQTEVLSPSAIGRPGAAQGGVFALLVSEDANRESVRVFDTAAADGTFRAGGAWSFAGNVNPGGLDLRGSILRLVASDYNPDGGGNFLRTFDVRDPSKLTPIANCSIANSDALLRQQFLPDRVLVWTGNSSLNTVRALSIGPDGQCAPFASAVGQDWSQTMLSVAQGSRLIGVGVPRDGVTPPTGALRLLLHDVSNATTANEILARLTLSLPAPLIARPDAAFAIEGIAMAQAADGSAETGLLAIPYAAADGSAGGVQLVSFGDHTLTQRGRTERTTGMIGFAAGSTAVLLSDVGLGLLAPAAIGEPDRVAHIELAPEYTQIFRFGDHVARVRTLHRPGLPGMPNEVPLGRRVEVAAAGDPQLGATLASFDVSLDAGLYQVGTLLVVLDASGVLDPQPAAAEVVVYDLSKPEMPVRAGSVSSPELAWHLPPSAALRKCTPFQVPLGGLATAPLPPCSVRPWPESLVVGSALVLISPQIEQQARFEFWIVDLSDPKQPVVRPKLESSCGDVGRFAFVSGKALYYAATRTSLTSELRPQVIHYLTRIDLSDPGHPQLAEPINVPGQAFAANEAGDVVYTVDHEYPDTTNTREAKLHKLSLHDGYADVVKTHALPMPLATGIGEDGAGHVLVASWPVPQTMSMFAPAPSAGKLEILAAEDLTTSAAPTPEAIGGTSVRCARAGRIVIEQRNELTIIDARDSSPSTRDVQSGSPSCVTPYIGLSCDDDAVYWANSRCGTGRIGL